MPAELKIQVRFLLGALLETTRKRVFLCAQANLYAVSYNTALGALLETTRKRGFLCAQANLYAVPYNTALGALLETTRKRGFFGYWFAISCAFIMPCALFGHSK